MAGAEASTEPAANQTTANRIGSFITRNMRRRYGITMMLSLALWPFLGFVPALETVLRNALLLESYVQLGFLTAINTIAIFFCIAIQRLLNARFPGGWWHTVFGDGSAPWDRRLLSLAFGLSAILPVVLAFSFGEDFPATTLSHIGWTLLFVSGGLGCGWLILLAAGFLKCRLFGSVASTRNFFPFEVRDEPGLIQTGRLAERLAPSFSWTGLEKIDLQFFSYLAILAIIHNGSTRWFSEPAKWLTSAPSMVVVLVWVLFMGLAGVANLLDRFRLPVVVVALVLVSVWQVQFDSTKNIRTFEDRSTNQFVAAVAEITEAERDFLNTPLNRRSTSRTKLIADSTRQLDQQAWDSIVQRLQQPPRDPVKGKTLVVVTCPGGGIHAAAWSACVLDRLSSEYEEFAESVCVISAVSGGSVGTLMFVSSRYDEALTGRKVAAGPPPATNDLHEEIRTYSPSLDLAARSSLESIAYGITADDLYGLIHPMLSASDRGQRLEDSFQACLPQGQSGLTLGDWGDRAIEGTVPIVIFNATDAATGRRILFDTVPTPRRQENVGMLGRPLNYRELLEGAVDVKPATAARTSATFPYVSPFTKPEYASPSGEAVALCDGGYVDNEGIVTAVNWIDFLINRNNLHKAAHGEAVFDRILLLRIEPSSTADNSTEPEPGGVASWFRWIFGPAEAMVNVRSSSQVERGNLESELATPGAAPAASGNLESVGGSSIEDGPRYSRSVNPLESAQGLNVQLDEAAFRRKDQSAEENREEWDRMVDELKRELEGAGSAPDPGEGINQSTGELQDTDSAEYRRLMRLPVVVQTIRFENADQKIPLNWKLSGEQKLWYILAWRRCTADDSALRRTLDSFFTRKGKADTP